MELKEPTKEVIELVSKAWSNKMSDNDINKKITNFFLDSGITENEAERIYEIIKKSGNDDEKLSEVFKKYSDDSENDVLFKILLLDKLYSTQIVNPINIAKRIVNIKEKISKAENTAEVVEIIAGKTNNEEKTRREYSFATKYCSWSNPDKYYIYDEIVAKMLYEYNKKRNFCDGKTVCMNTSDTKKFSLKRYNDFCDVYEKFKGEFSLNECSNKDIDRFLWTYGKLLQKQKNISNK